VISHFVVSTVEGSMITLCGAVIPPRDASGARVGRAYAKACPDCDEKVAQAWVSFPR